MHTLNTKTRSRLSVFVLLCVLMTFPQQGEAFTYTKNNIVTTKELTNWQYLTTKGIEQFLQSNDSVLHRLKTTSKNGKKTVRVAEVIANASQRYKLNPMMFLVMAQKESGAITRNTMTESIQDWLLGFGRCDSCTKEQAAEYKGIANQIHSAGNQIRNGYLADLNESGTTISGWKVGSSKTTIDGIEVTPENDATAALYTYNPCVGAYGGGYPQYGCNSLFQKLWQEWNPEDISKIRYPNGSIIQVNSTQYIIEKGKKRKLSGPAAQRLFQTVQSAIPVPVVVAAQYQEGRPLVLPDDTLVRAPSGAVFYITAGKKHGITSAQALAEMRINQSAIVDASWAQLNAVPDGRTITVQNALTTAEGTLAQNNKTGGVYWISEDGAQPVWARTVLENRFSDRVIIQANPKDITSHKVSDPVGFADGTLLTSQNGGSVYVITNGRRRPIASAEAFEYYGYRWDQIIVVEDAVLKIHARGRTLDIPKFESAK